MNMKSSGTFMQRLPVAAVIVLLFTLLFGLSSPSVFSMVVVVSTAYILYYEFFPLLRATGQQRYYWFPLYPLVCCACLVLLNHLYHIWFLFVFCGAMAHDTGAYLAGTIIGKHTLAPAISPSKTWEGFCGGVGATYIVALWFWWYYGIGYPYGSAMLLALIFSLIATTGDLTISYLKRRAGWKDTGTLLPGHGGLLDRFDSIYAVSPLVVVIAYFMK